MRENIENSEKSLSTIFNSITSNSSRFYLISINNLNGLQIFFIKHSKSQSKPYKQRVNNFKGMHSPSFESLIKYEKCYTHITITHYSLSVQNVDVTYIIRLQRVWVLLNNSLSPCNFARCVLLLHWWWIGMGNDKKSWSTFTLFLIPFCTAIVVPAQQWAVNLICKIRLWTLYVIKAPF